MRKPPLSVLVLSFLVAAAIAAIPMAANSSVSGNTATASSSKLETAITWDGKVFVNAGELRAHLLKRGVSWSQFLAKHPAIATRARLPFVSWNNKRFYDQASLVTELAAMGIPYRVWARNHPQAAATLTGSPAARARPKHKPTQPPPPTSTIPPTPTTTTPPPPTTTTPPPPTTTTATTTPPPPTTTTPPPPTTTTPPPPTTTTPPPPTTTTPPPPTTTTPPPVSVGSALPARMPESSGGSFYVDGGRGSDSNPGTLAAPWKTINQALAAVPLSGSVINVRAGTYVGMHVFQNRYASAGNPVTLQPYPGERVVLTAPANQDQHVLLVFKAGGIRIRGFEITDPTSDLGIKVENGKDVEIVGCDIHHTGRSGVFVGGSGSSAPTGSSNVQIWNNRFHDNGGNMNVAGGASSGQGGHSVYWGGVSSNSDGVDHRTVRGVIANNLFYNQPYGFQLQIGTQADGLIVTNNTFYRAYYPSGAGTAIEFYTESASAATFGTRNVTVVNNLITNAVSMGVYGYGGGAVMSSNSVRNNLAYGNAQGDFLHYYGSTANVLFTLGTNITGKSPLFVDAGGLDFRLQATSPALGKADANYTPATDFAGKPRTSAPDLGAYES